MELRNIPRKRQTRLIQKPFNVWNTKKEATEEFNIVCSDDKKSTTDLAGDMERKIIKQKFAAFGKIKVKKNRVDEDLQNEIKSTKLEN